MTSVLNLPQVRGLLSSEHFSVDGTLIEAWASDRTMSLSPRSQVSASPLLRCLKLDAHQMLFEPERR
jgi:hypothetical protein